MLNPLIQPSELPFQAVDFSNVKSQEFIPSLKEAISIAKDNIEKIKSTPEAANFENTILALEHCAEEVDQVTNIYFNLFSAHADEEHQKLAQEMSSLSSDFSSDLLLDNQIFQRVKEVFDRRSSENYNQEQTQLLEKTYKGFVRNGALLEDDKKSQLRNIDQKLSKLSPQFSENVLKDTNAFSYHVTNKEKLKGLPESSVNAAAQAAKEKNLEGWVFTLDAPSFIPFLTYSEDREAREKLWRAYNSCATQGESDNQPILKEIAHLRHQRAEILGFETHSHFVLSERMAESPVKVHDFLQTLLEKSKPAAERDVEEIKEFKKILGDDSEFMPWDFAFYSEKLKEKKFEFNQEELRPYFKLENVIAGAFEHAKKLYQIEFKERTDMPVYHEDVKVFEVTQSTNQDFVGLFYTDFFPRKTKRNGAWMTNYREQGLSRKGLLRPHVSIVCNFTKPTPEQPSLLTLDEVRTLFHEFGHALHSLLSKCNYSSISGTNVYWDFVELPSQINENWILEKETLDSFAKHYKTGETLPVEYIEKIKKASQFQAGYACIRQLNFAMLDMAWHSKNPGSVDSVEEFEKDVTKQTQVLPRVEGTLTSPRFSHIFAGGYSSGYYSYKWAEVLDADAFELFKEKGLYDPETARSFKENILERGGTDHPMTLYKNFRGREPDTGALLRRDGLV